MHDRNPTRLFLMLLAAMLVATPVVRPAFAQRVAPDALGEVLIEADALGVGGIVRSGDMTGLRLAVTDSADAPRNVVVRITLQDADGDPVQYERGVTTNPGVRQPVWIYLRLPYRFRDGDELIATVHLATDEGGRAGAAGRVLGSARISPRQGTVLSPIESMIAVVGRRDVGLGRYGVRMGLNDPTPASGHERTEIVTGVRAEGLPDRWFALAPFEALVWTEEQPATLGAERAAAIREWVTRGGHLIVVLPRVGQTWLDQASNPLIDIMPAVRAERRDGVDLEELRLLLTKNIVGRLLEVPRNESLHILTPLPGAAPSEAMRILERPNGESIVARRLVGTGAVTLIGIDLTSQGLAMRGLPDTDQFWHRVLGRRGETRTEQEVRAAQWTFRAGERVSLDRDIADQIAKSGRAAAGVMIGFVVFITYWLVAGPVGFALLKRTGMTRHAWVAFVGAAGVFTAVAWGGVTALKPSAVEGSHLTFLDHVYGQDVQRARTWVNLLIPEYGRAGVAVVDMNTPSFPGERRLHQAIWPWEPPAIGLAPGRFPDTQGYRIESRAPEVVEIPVRSTVKQLQLEWAGGPRWGMPRPTGPDEGVEPGISLDESNRLSGVLVHGLPAPLEEVVIVVVQRQVTLRGSLGNNPVGAIAAYALAGPWEPGQPLDLGGLGGTHGRRSLTFLRDLIDASGTPDLDGGQRPDPQRLGTRLTALAFFHQIEPPDHSERATQQQRRLAQRRASHGWDLGRWFTQPCVIVVGQVRGPAPTPLMVDTGGGWKHAATDGRTVVRWVYALADDPPRFGSALDTPEASAVDRGEGQEPPEEGWR